MQCKPSWLPQDGVPPWSPTDHVTFSKFLRSSALPLPEILAEGSGVTGMAGGGEWARIFGRTAVQTRPIGQKGELGR